MNCGIYNIPNQTRHYRRFFVGSLWAFILVSIRKIINWIERDERDRMSPSNHSDSIRNNNWKRYFLHDYLDNDVNATRDHCSPSFSYFHSAHQKCVWIRNYLMHKCIIQSYQICSVYLRLCHVYLSLVETQNPSRKMNSTKNDT